MSQPSQSSSTARSDGVVKFEPRNLINAYRADSEAKEYHSQFQFDFTHAASVRYLNQGQKNHQDLALWLSSLLAHWGMFRGSSEIRNKNAHFFEALVRHSLAGKRPALKSLIDVSFNHLHILSASEIDDDIQKLGDWLKKHGISATDTLVSKIVLGVLGNVPGYDRNFSRGLKNLKISGQYHGITKFCGRGLLDLSTWSKSFDWPNIKSVADRRRNLPLARLVDMSIFEYGVIK